MENGRMGCINRDHNAVINMRTITEYWLEHRERLQIFSRKKKFAKSTTNKRKRKKGNTIKVPKKEQ